MARLLWTQRQDIGPAARGNHVMAYDGSRKVVVLFGGDTTDVSAQPQPSGEPRFFGDTWVWDGEGWLQVADIGPRPSVVSKGQGSQVRLSMIFDSTRECCVLVRYIQQTFISGATIKTTETWEWDGIEWTQIADTGPGEYNGTLAYYEANQRVVFFGNGKTWEWDGAEWIQREDTGPQTIGVALAYDAARKRIVLFGLSRINKVPVGETWEWDGESWKQQSDFGPAPRFGHAMEYDRARERTVLFGGVTERPHPSGGVITETVGDTWEWDGKRWVQSHDMGPDPRCYHAMAYDSARKRMILFGGELGYGIGVYVRDTWELREYSLRNV
jgi:hypothetical protein